MASDRHCLSNGDAFNSTSSANQKNGHFTSDSNTEQLLKTVMDSNKKSSNPNAPLTSKVSAGNPSSSQRGGGSTPTKTGGGAAPIQGASSSANGGGSKPNGSSNSNSKPIIGKNGRPINTGSAPAVKAVPLPVAHKYNGRLCLTCIKTSCFVKRIRMPSLKDILAELQETGPEAFQAKYSSSIEENRLMHIDPMNHQGYKRSVWIRNNALLNQTDKSSLSGLQPLKGLIVPSELCPSASGNLIDSSLPAEKWFLLLLPESGKTVNPSGQVLAGEIVDSIFGLTRNGGVSRNGDAFMLINEKLLQDHQLPLSVLLQITNEGCVAHRCAVSMISYCRMHGIPLTSNIIEDAFTLQKEREAAIKMNEEAVQNGLDAALEILGQDYANLSLKFKDYLTFLLLEFESQLYGCTPIKQSYESKRKEHPDISGLVYSICRSIEGWTESPCANLEACLEIVINNRDYATRFCAFMHKIYQRACVKIHPDKTGDLDAKTQERYSVIFMGLTELLADIKCFLCTGSDETSTEKLISDIDLKRYRSLVTSLWCAKNRCNTELARYAALCDASCSHTEYSSSAQSSSSTSSSSSALTTMEVSIKTLVERGLPQKQLDLLVCAAKHAPKQVYEVTDALLQLSSKKDANQDIASAATLQTSFATSQMDNSSFEVTPKDISTTMVVAFQYEEVFEDVYPVLSLVNVQSKSEMTRHFKVLEESKRANDALKELEEQERMLDEVIVTEEDIAAAIRDYKDKILSVEGTRSKMRHELVKYADRIFGYLKPKTLNLDMFAELIYLFRFNSDIKQVIDNIILASRSPTCDPNKLRRDFCDCLTSCDFDAGSFYSKKNEITMKENEMNRKQNMAGSGRRANRIEAAKEEHALPSEQTIVGKFKECDAPMIKFICRESALPRNTNMLYKRFKYTLAKYSEESVEEEAAQLALKSKGLVEIIVHRSQDLKKSDKELCDQMIWNNKREYVCFEVSSIKKDSTGRLTCKNVFTRDTVDIVTDTAPVWAKIKKNHMIVRGKVDWELLKLHAAIPKDCEISVVVGIVLDGSIVEILTGREYEFTKIRNDEFERHGVAIPKLPTLWDVTENSKDYENDRKRGKVSHHVDRVGINQHDESNQINDAEGCDYFEFESMIQTKSELEISSEIRNILSAEKQTNFKAFEAELKVLISRYSDDESYRRQVFLERMVEKYSADQSKLDTHLSQGESIIKAFESIDVKAMRSSAYAFSIEEEEKQKDEERLKIANISQVVQVFCNGFDLWTEYDNLVSIEMSKEHAMRIIRQHETALRVSLDGQLFNILVEAVNKYFEDRLKLQTEQGDEYVCEIEYACGGGSGLWSDDEEEEEVEETKSDSKPLTRKAQRQIRSEEKKKSCGGKKEHTRI